MAKRSEAMSPWTPVTQHLALALCLAALLLPPSSGQTVPPNSCSMGEASNISQEIPFPVGGTHNACLHARLINTTTYWLFTPMATSTALSYRVDGSSLFALTCTVMATGQVLVKVPQEPGFNIYTIMYDAGGGVSGEIVIHSGSTGAYTIIESGTVVPGVVAWRAYSDSQNVLAQYELCQKDRDGTLRTYEAGRLRAELAVADICDNQNDGVFTPISFTLLSSQGSTTGSFTLVVARGSCASALPSDRTTDLSYVVPDPTTPTSVTSSPTASPTIQTTAPSGPNRDVTPVVVGVVVTLVIVIVVGVLVVVCCLCLWRRSKANQQPHLPVRAIQIQDITILSELTKDAIEAEPEDTTQGTPVHQNGVARPSVDLRNSPLLSNLSLTTELTEVSRGEMVVAYSNPKLAAVADSLKKKHGLPMQKLIPFEQERNADTVSRNLSRVLNSENLKPFYIIWTGNYKLDTVIQLIVKDLISRSYGNLKKVVLVQLGGDVNGLTVLVQDRINLIQLSDDPLSSVFDPDVCADRIRQQAASSSPVEQQHARVNHGGTDVPDTSSTSEEHRRPSSSQEVEQPNHTHVSLSPPSNHTPSSLLNHTHHQEQPSQPSADHYPPADHPHPSPPPISAEQHTSPTSSMLHHVPPPPYYSTYPEAMPVPAVDDLRGGASKQAHSVPVSADSSPMTTHSSPILQQWMVEQTEQLVKLAKDVKIVGKKVENVEATVKEKAANVEATVVEKAANVEAAVEKVEGEVRTGVATIVDSVGSAEAQAAAAVDTTVKIQETLDELNNKDKEKTVFTDDQP